MLNYLSKFLLTFRVKMLIVVNSINFGVNESVEVIKMKNLKA